MSQRPVWNYKPRHLRMVTAVPFSSDADEGVALERYRAAWAIHHHYTDGWTDLQRIVALEDAWALAWQLHVTPTLEHHNGVWYGWHKQWGHPTTKTVLQPQPPPPAR